ncbi:MAG: hypothetical protein QOK49_2527, partial [Baekduia sp.]|nr:hypothetical protein [Baekduia sp.]
ANLRLQPGAILNTTGHRIFVRGTLSMGNASRISNDGGDATPTAAGAGAPAATAGGGVGGGPGNTIGPSPTTPTLGGTGGVGTAIPVWPPYALSASESLIDLQTVPQALSGHLADGVRYTGGIGGGGQHSATAGGGGGGGVVIVAAQRITVDGTAAITARGGAGGQGSGGGGGGAGGGVVVLVSEQSLPGGLSLAVDGGHAGGTGAQDGHAGRVIAITG